MLTNEFQKASWISKTPGVCGGEPCVRDTRYTVAGLVEWRRLGLSDSRIMEHHPDLTRSDLDVAWSYYLEHSEEIDQILREDEDA